MCIRDSCETVTGVIFAELQRTAAEKVSNGTGSLLDTSDSHIEALVTAHVDEWCRRQAESVFPPYDKWLDFRGILSW